jgi:hypothetical protein
MPHEYVRFTMIVEVKVHRKSRQILLMILKEYVFLIGLLPEIRANYAKIIEKKDL